MSNRKSILLLVVIWFAVAVFIVLDIQIKHLPSSEILKPTGKNVNKTTTRKNDTKLILLWTKYWNKIKWPSEMFFNFSRCSQRNCETTEDKSRLDEADMVLFLCVNIQKDALPPRRHLWQKWAFFCQESQPVVEDMGMSQLASSSLHRRWWTDGLFNLTISKRHDSTLRYPRGLVIDKPQIRIKDRTALRHTLLERISNKTELAAWAVSHCRTDGNRESYIKRMEEFAPITKFGGCFNRSFPGPIDDKQFGNFFFYLGFENALCVDYATEKFFEILRQTTMVPVVFGRADYLLEGPGADSYISAMDYPDPKDLAERLLYLQAHPEEYVEYLMWKGRSDIIPYPGACDICAYLHDDQLMGSVTVVDDFSGWWNKGLKCQEWRDNQFVALGDMTE